MKNYTYFTSIRQSDHTANAHISFSPLQPLFLSRQLMKQSQKCADGTHKNENRVDISPQRRRVDPTYVKTDELPRRWMLKVLAILLRTWQLFLSDFQQVRVLWPRLLVALIVRIFVIVNAEILIYNSNAAACRLLLCLHFTVNFGQLLLQLIMCRAVLQIEYPGESAVTNKLVIC